ncbi:MAG: O-antigen ligase family protein [Verrucomicrobia bacterium]|nr:O-antigen ligase family protein [Verrucomicrobiota bacterium]
MGLDEQPQMPGLRATGRIAAVKRSGRVRKRRSLRPLDVQIYQACEALTEPLIYLMVLFSPWAFGTSQPWAIWGMTIAGYLLGGMLVVKLAIRWFKGYRPPRWDGELGEESRKQKAESRNEEEGEGIGNPKSEIRNAKEVRHQESQVRKPRSEVRGRRLLTSSRLTAILGWLTVAILGYCLISALNARATYLPQALRFAYHDRCIRWLPHSLDSNQTWFAFWSYLGLALSFWAVRDWLLGKSAIEERAEVQVKGRSSETRAEFVPARMRRLFWLLAINGGLLGLEGIIQRIEGSGKLRFLVRPQIHKTAATQFGPYAYYANASQYFNLLWPVCLGFWWVLHQSQGFKRNGHHVLLLCSAIMAACPIISTCRGGALISVGMLALAAPFLLVTQYFSAAHRRQDRSTRTITLGVLALFFAGALVLGFSLGWKALKPRMATIHQGFQYRERDYDRARPMAADYPIFGTGPGSFANVSQLYRTSTTINWYEQLHNDWLETRITFGRVGSALIALAFATVVLRWIAPGGIQCGGRFVLLMWLALSGCLLHARFDFPFQMHSIVFLFLVLCATLFNLSRRPSVQ